MTRDDQPAGRPFRPDEAEALDALAVALTAPGRPSEAGGLAPALAEFRSSADVEPQRTRRRLPRRKAILVSAVTAALLIASATSAAQHSALPGPMQQLAHSVLGRIGVRTPARHPHGKPADAGAAKNSQRPSASPSSPDPADVLQLCQELARGGYDLHSRVINPAARDELTAAAGDETKIVPYCISLLTAAGLPVGTPAPTGGVPIPH